MKYLKCIFNFFFVQTEVFEYLSRVLIRHTVNTFVHLTWFCQMLPWWFQDFLSAHKAGWSTVLCVTDKKPLCTACHARRGTQHQSLSHSVALIKQLPPQPQSRGCSRESATLIWAGLFLAAMDCERALVLFQSFTGWARSTTITVFGAPWVCSHFPQAYRSTTWMDINLTNALRAFLCFSEKQKALAVFCVSSLQQVNDRVFLLQELMPFPCVCVWVCVWKTQLNRRKLNSYIKV